jgi:hypothetical protein
MNPDIHHSAFKSLNHNALKRKLQFVLKEWDELPRNLDSIIDKHLI